MFVSMHISILILNDLALIVLKKASDKYFNSTCYYNCCVKFKRYKSSFNLCLCIFIQIVYRFLYRWFVPLNMFRVKYSCLNS